MDREVSTVGLLAQAPHPTSPRKNGERGRKAIPILNGLGRRRYFPHPRRHQSFIFRLEIPVRGDDIEPRKPHTSRTSPPSETDILSRMDDSAITKQHWKIMFISGMGFFTDAYDLFIIGVVMSLLKDEWHPSPVAVGLVTSTALLASAFGAILFGRVADMLGRKRIYGYEVLVLAVQR